jgi:hypothetical protein
VRTALICAVAAAIVVPGGAAYSPPAAVFRTAAFVQSGIEKWLTDANGTENHMSCSGLDEGRAPVYRYFACILYVRDSDRSPWKVYPDSRYVHPPGSREFGRFGHGAHHDPRRSEYGENPRVFGGLQTRGAQTIEVLLVSRPTRRIRVVWTLICANRLDRIDTFSRSGSFVVSRRGHIRIALPGRPPRCLVMVDGRAQSKTTAHLHLRISRQ